METPSLRLWAPMSRKCPCISGANMLLLSNLSPARRQGEPKENKRRTFASFLKSKLKRHQFIRAILILGKSYS
jgi:hypothetical protein